MVICTLVRKQERWTLDEILEIRDTHTINKRTTKHLQDTHTTPRTSTRYAISRSLLYALSSSTKKESSVLKLTIPNPLVGCGHSLILNYDYIEDCTNSRTQHTRTHTQHSTHTPHARTNAHTQNQNVCTPHARAHARAGAVVARRETFRRELRGSSKTLISFASQNSLLIPGIACRLYLPVAVMHCLSV